uniref:DKNYY family protein n=1 Tax=Rhabditophanes sp. KR3021 TaxID=114890 RepID=A0AC35UC15_9BILA
MSYWISILFVFVLMICCGGSQPFKDEATLKGEISPCKSAQDINGIFLTKPDDLLHTVITSDCNPDKKAEKSSFERNSRIPYNNHFKYLSGRLMIEDLLNPMSEKNGKIGKYKDHFDVNNFVVWDAESVYDRNLRSKIPSKRSSWGKKGEILLASRILRSDPNQLSYDFVRFGKRSGKKVFQGKVSKTQDVVKRNSQIENSNSHYGYDFVRFGKKSVQIEEAKARNDYDFVRFGKRNPPKEETKSRDDYDFARFGKRSIDHLNVHVKTKLEKRSDSKDNYDFVRFD